MQSTQGLSHQCLPAQLLWTGQRTQTLPRQAVKIPEYYKNQVFLAGTQKQITQSRYTVRRWETEASKHQRQLGHRAGGISRFILICESSLEQTHDMSSFHFDGKMYHPKTYKHMQQYCSCSTAKSIQPKHLIKSERKPVGLELETLFTRLMQVCQPKPHSNRVECRNRKKAAPAHPAAPNSCALTLPASTRAKS